MNPSCPNSLFEPLLVKKIAQGKLSEKEDMLYGQLILSLVEIVLNNPKFKYQSEYLKDDIRLEMIEDILTNVPKTFNPTKGKAYSYAFRTAYTARNSRS